MMLAKFSGIPISTQTSSVMRPASSSGTSVSSTSPKRRSTIHSRIAIETSAKMPAWMKARTIVLPDSRIEIGVPTASGNCAWMARAKWRSVSLSLGSPFGVAWIRIAAVGRRSIGPSTGWADSAASPVRPADNRASPSARCAAARRRPRPPRRACPVSASASLVRLAARRLAASAPEPLALLASFVSVSAEPCSAATVWASVGGRAVSSVLNGVCNCRASPRISASLRSWSVRDELGDRA